MIEVVPPSAKRDVNKQVIVTASTIARCWPARRILVDFHFIQGFITKESGATPIDEFFDNARKEKIDAIPVTSPGNGKAYHAAVRRVLELDNRGLAMRVGPDVSLDEGRRVKAIDILLTHLGASADVVDLVLDFGTIRGLHTNLLSHSMHTAIASLPHLSEWRSLTVAGSSFPKNLGEIQQGEWTYIERSEWLAWRALAGLKPKIARLPWHGDYSVGSPDLPFTGMANLPASLRYSVGDDFLVWRGYSLKTHARGYLQICDICADLSGRSDFAGASFSPGDSEIRARAAMSGSPGGPSQWRAWATNHYIELVVSQLANLPSP